MSHTLGNVVNGVGRGVALSQTFLLLNLLQNARGKSFCVARLEVREVLNTTPGKASQRGSVGSLNFSHAETPSVHTVAITGATLGAYARKLGSMFSAVSGFLSQCPGGPTGSLCLT